MEAKGLKAHACFDDMLKSQRYIGPWYNYSGLKISSKTPLVSRQWSRVNIIQTIPENCGLGLKMGSVPGKQTHLFCHKDRPAIEPDGF